MKMTKILLLIAVTGIPVLANAEQAGGSVRASRDASVLDADDSLGGAESNSLYVNLAREMQLAERKRESAVDQTSVDVLSGEVRDRLEELKALSGLLETKIEQKTAENGNLKLLVTLYESISADQAAELLKRIPFPVSLTVFQMMSPRKSAKILAAMDPKIGAELSRRLIKMPAPVASNALPEGGK